MRLLLKDNPLECSCHHEWLQTLAEYQDGVANVAITDMDQVHCNHVIRNEVGLRLLASYMRRGKFLCKEVTIIMESNI